MKKLLLALLIFSFLPQTKAQYHQMAIEGRSWYVVHSPTWMQTNTSIYTIDGDTIVRGINYQRLVEEDTAGNYLRTAAFLNEDTVSGRIDMYTMGFSGLNSLDTTFYDFSGQTGDTISYKGFMDGRQERLVIDSTFQMTDLLGNSRKVIWLANTPDTVGWCSGGQVVEIWIEGLGSVNNTVMPLLHTCGAIIEAGWELNCVFNNDGIPVYKGQNYQQCYILSESEEAYSQMDIYPNPSSDLLHWDHELAISSLAIRSIDGQLIQAFSNPRGSVDISHLPTGVYTVIMEDVEGES